MNRVIANVLVNMSAIIRTQRTSICDNRRDIPTTDIKWQYRLYACEMATHVTLEYGMISFFESCKTLMIHGSKQFAINSFMHVLRKVKHMSNHHLCHVLTFIPTISIVSEGPHCKKELFFCTDCE